MHITLFGCGYVGLVTAACLASFGHQVTCIDSNATRIATLQQGVCPIYEVGLPELLAEQRAAGRLHFTTELESATSQAEILFICVGTPQDAEGRADLTAVHRVAVTIAPIIAANTVVVTKSTVPVGTAEQVARIIKETQQQHAIDRKFYIAANPEFLREGTAVNDFMHPDRIILGTAEDDAKTRLMQLYAPFHDQATPILCMDCRSAELCKYAANALLATKISFINEISRLATLLQADIEWIREGLALDPRIGPHFIQAGCGYGGSCFPKDVKALIHSAREVHDKAPLLRATDEVNDQQKQRLAAMIQQHFAHELSGKTIAVWGLAFKPGTDDMRDAPSIPLLQSLLTHGATVRAYDPAAQAAAQAIFSSATAVTFVDDARAALAESDALVIVTEWEAFKQFPLPEIARQLRQPVIFDGRNCFRLTDMQRLGFTYYSIGRPVVMAETALASQAS